MLDSELTAAIKYRIFLNLSAKTSLTLQPNLTITTITAISIINTNTIS